MRFVPVTLAVTFAMMTLLSASMAFAHEHACAAYEATCNNDQTVTTAPNKKAKWQAMMLALPLLPLLTPETVKSAPPKWLSMTTTTTWMVVRHQVLQALSKFSTELKF